MFQDALDAVARFAEVLDQKRIGYLLGGSMASIVYGEPRATRDADFVIDVGGVEIGELVEVLRAEFYVDLVAARRAVETGDCFNLIHNSTVFQIDVFTPKASTWQETQLKRRTKQTINYGSRSLEVWMPSPEDVVLNKLLWFKLGNEVSVVQWGDALGILRIQRGRLDEAHLRSWSQHLDVSELLDKAMEAC